MSQDKYRDKQASPPPQSAAWIVYKGAGQAAQAMAEIQPTLLLTHPDWGLPQKGHLLKFTLRCLLC